MDDMRTEAVSPPEVELIRGLPVSGRSFVVTVQMLLDWAQRRDRMRYFACLNAHSAEVAHRDDRFMDALKGADLLVADGAGIVLASMILGGRIRERATGPDLFLAVSEGLDRAGGKSVFYLGGNDETLDRIRARHAKRFPNLAVVGTYSPPYHKQFSDDELGRMAEMVGRAAPDVLWVGLGAPKQEKLILALRDRLQVPLCGPIGAMFDYFADNVAMPHAWVERAGLHWLYRLMKNPGRLWRRNLDSPLFLGRVAWDRLCGCRCRP